VIAVAAALAALAVAVALARPADATRRLQRPAPGPSAARALSASTACAVGGLGLAVVGGWPTGAVLGTLVALGGPALLARLEPACARREREQLVTELPVVLDLLAACLAGGSTLAAAADVVARALPGPCGRRLAAVRDALAVGTPPDEAWAALSAHRTDDPLAGPARLLARAAEGGTPAAAAVAQLAAEARATARAAGSEAARRVGVLVVAPLGLAFLPAFVLLGIVPVVVGLAAPLLATF
jgi:pilus assembly protein TadC